MRIAFATIHDVTTTMSGFSSFNAAGYYLARALTRAGAKVDCIGPMRESFGPLYWAKQMYHQKVTGKTYNRHRERRAVRDFGRQISRKLQQGNYDVVFSPLSPGSQPVAYLECKQPIVICTDSPLAIAAQSYPALTRAAAVKSNLQSGLDNERSALTRAALVSYPSTWAVNAAVATYQLEPKRVRAIPWGANLESHRTINDVRWMIDGRQNDVCRILFVGLEWERKGGPAVVAAAQELTRRGVHVELNIVGCDPFEVQICPEFARVHGRLRRTDAHQSQKFDELFATSHVLFVPSQAEAFGHVFAEASSFGVPSITTDVEGIPAAVRNGINGINFPLQTPPEIYAHAIASLISNRDQYRKLALSSFTEYETRLNWDATARSLIEAMAALLSLRPPVAACAA